MSTDESCPICQTGEPEPDLVIRLRRAHPSLVWEPSPSRLLILDHLMDDCEEAAAEIERLRGDSQERYEALRRCGELVVAKDAEIERLRGEVVMWQRIAHNAPCEHQWIDTGFADLDECSICHVTTRRDLHD